MIAAEAEILLAWQQYQSVERYGLAFGEVCYRWQQKLKGGIGRKGQGLSPMLETLKIPSSTAYWWIDRYKESAGLKDAPPKPARQAGPLPAGTYRVILADPPWAYDAPLPANYGAAVHHYRTMPVSDICNLRLPQIAADAALFLWVPVPHLENAFEVISAWKFRYASNIVWDKAKHNWGHFVSIRHEHLLLAVRGHCLPEARHVDSGGVERAELIPSVQCIQRTEHSRKPERFREIIDRMYPARARIDSHRTFRTRRVTE